jgi:hypothetical protein
MELDRYDIEMMMMNARNVRMLRIHQFGMLQHYPLFNSKCGVVLWLCLQWVLLFMLQLWH